MVTPRSEDANQTLILKGEMAGSKNERFRLQNGVNLTPKIASNMLITDPNHPVLILTPKFPPKLRKLDHTKCGSKIVTFLTKGYSGRVSQK